MVTGLRRLRCDAVQCDARRGAIDSRSGLSGQACIPNKTLLYGEMHGSKQVLYCVEGERGLAQSTSCPEAFRV